MASNTNPFLTAHYEKTVLTQQTAKRIQRIYKQSAQDIEKKLRNLKMLNPSDSLKKVYFENLLKDIDRSSASFNKLVQSTIMGAGEQAGSIAVDAGNKMMKLAGLGIKGAYSYIPRQQVLNIASGKLYGDSWSLSQSIWKSGLKTKSDIQNVVAKGLTENKPTKAIADDLMKYVDPTARKPWDWSKVYPGTAAKVDYNAQRLARTMIQHSFQASLVQSQRYNPFCKGVIWHSVGLHGRTCEQCLERDGNVFPVKDLPLDHPNGLCYFEPALDSMNDIADRLGDWVNGKEDQELETWMKSCYGKDWISPKSSPYVDELKTKGYVGLSRKESDEFIERYHNKSLLRKSMNTMDGAQSNRINGALRKDRLPTNPSDVKFMERLDKAITKNSLPEDMTLFRGVNLSAFDDYEVFLDFEKLASKVSMDAYKTSTGAIDYGAWGKEFEKATSKDIENLLERGKKLLGTVVEDKGYMQVSASSQRNIFGFSDINLQLHAPKGFPAYISNYKEESEIILPRGTRYEIVDVKVSTFVAENGARKEVLQLIAKIIL